MTFVNAAGKSADRQETSALTVLVGAEALLEDGIAVDPQLLAIAQGRLTLALCERVAELSIVVAEVLGDDSHLDGIKREIRDGLEGIRSDGIGVG